MASGATGKENIFEGMMKFLSTGAFAWPRPAAQEISAGAKGKAKNSTDRKDRNSLAAALRSRGGATQAAKPSRKRPTRGRSRHSEVEQSSATSSASATSSTSATSTSEKRPTSWAPNATVLAEQFGDLLHRGMEAAGQWRASPEALARRDRKAHESRQRQGGAQQRLQYRLQEWFDKQHEFQGAPPRLTSRLFPVQHGPIVYTQVLLVWRGIEIQLLLGPSERDTEFAIFGARTECHLVGDSIRRALEDCFEGPLEVFMESLMPVDEDISEEDEASVQVEHDALVQFISNRPRMHRLQKAPNGIAFAWDFPLSRQERMEFFLVNTLAQEASEADQQELEEAPPLRQRRWSRASGRSRASDS